jgi:hypothetical protein
MPGSRLPHRLPLRQGSLDWDPRRRGTGPARGAGEVTPLDQGCGELGGVGGLGDGIVVSVAVLAEPERA